MNYILFDSSHRSSLLPLTFTRPVADLRIGILTIREKWEFLLGEKTSTLTESYLSEKFPLVKAKSNILINGSVCPNKELVQDIVSLKPGQTLVRGEAIIAMALTEDTLETFDGEAGDGIQTISIENDFVKIDNTWDLFKYNDRVLREDFEMITKGRKSQPLSKTNSLVNPKDIFVEEGAVVEFSILNASTGPIYIGKDAEIMEGAKVRGPLALCNNSVLKMDAKIYGATTIGPHSKVGGEVNNSVLLGYSNK
ncbi:MAG: glucose-1-phosphate thymidylyltransferase, partial [Bacteroidales bacterium]|nr:glucose-1-phosphate thymidylyltransferase [Bacteroidales bacterium]